MSVSYTYVLSVDFSASNIDLVAFQSTISGSSISSATIQYITRSGTSVAVFFSGTLSGPDQTTLTSLVSAYVFITPTTLVYVDTTTSQPIANKTLNTSNTIVDATVTTKVLGFSLTGMTSSTQLTLASTISANRIYTFPDAGVNSNILLTNSSGSQTIASGNLAFSNTSSILTLANTTGSTSSSTGALQVAGGASFGASTLNAALAAFTGPGSTSTSGSTIFVNPASTALSGASTYFFTYLAAPVSTVSSFTGTATTLFVAGPPTITTGGTGLAANFAAGTVRIGGTLQIPTGAVNGYILSTDASGNASWISTGTLAFTGFSDGTVSAPGAYWLSQTSTGFYRPGSGQIFVSLAGTNTAGFTTTSTFSSVNLTLTGGGSTTNSSATAFVNPATTALTGASAYFFTHLAAPVTTASSFTGTASTLFIAGAPTMTTGGSGFSLNIAGGTSLFNGNIVQTGASSVVTLANTTASTSSSTGGLQVAGGAYFGANSLFNANVTLQGTSAVLALSGASSTVTLANTTASTSSSTGGLQVAGGAYFGANSLFNANLTVASGGSVILANTTASTSSSTGGLQVAGGAYFGANSLFNANLTLQGASAVLALSGASSTVTLANTTASTSSSSGSLQVAGGAFFGAGSLFNALTTFRGVGSTSASGSTIYINPNTTALTGASPYFFTYLAAPVTTASTFSSSASTLYIAGGPTVVTGGTGFALNVAAGTARIGGTLQIPTGATNGYVLTSDASGNASWAAGSAPTLSYFNAISNGTFSTNSTSLVNITTMTLTPTTAGTYWVTFTASFRVQNANTTATFDLALNGTSITNTPNTFVQNAQQNTYTVSITAVQAFNGTSDVVTARVSSSSGSSAITLTYRSIYAVRMSA